MKLSKTGFNRSHIRPIGVFIPFLPSHLRWVEQEVIPRTITTSRKHKTTLNRPEYLAEGIMIIGISNILPKRLTQSAGIEVF